MCFLGFGIDFGGVGKGEGGVKDGLILVFEQRRQVCWDFNLFGQEGCFWFKDFEEGRVREGVIGQVDGFFIRQVGGLDFEGFNGYDGVVILREQRKVFGGRVFFVIISKYYIVTGGIDVFSILGYVVVGDNEDDRVVASSELVQGFFQVSSIGYYIFLYLWYDVYIVFSAYVDFYKGVRSVVIYLQISQIFLGFFSYVVVQREFLEDFFTEVVVEGLGVGVVSEAYIVFRNVAVSFFYLVVQVVVSLWDFVGRVVMQDGEGDFEDGGQGVVYSGRDVGRSVVYFGERVQGGIFIYLVF